MEKSEADNLVKQAEKRLNAGFFSRMFSSKESRLEEALDLYERAANQFKLQKRWLEAGNCYENCSKIEEELGSDAAAGHYHDASHCYNFVDKKKANENMNKCLKVYEKQGRFQMAGKTQKQMAEDYEADLKYDEAIMAYKKAGEYFSMENQNSKTYEQGCLLKQADLMCISDHKDAFEEARQIYEKVAMQYLTVPLLKPGAKDLFFKCVVVHLAYDDYVTAEQLLQKFIMEDPTMDNTRESNFLSSVITAFKEKNVTDFKAAVTKLKTIGDIDKWRVNMFTRIMKYIENTSEDPYL